MTKHDISQAGAARPEGRGFSAAGNDGSDSSPVAGDSPTEGTVDGPLAPQASPRDAAETASEMRPNEVDPRKSDGVAEFKKMEQQAEEGRE